MRVCEHIQNTDFFHRKRHLSKSRCKSTLYCYAQIVLLPTDNTLSSTLDLWKKNVVFSFQCSSNKYFMYSLKVHGQETIQCLVSWKSDSIITNSTKDPKGYWKYVQYILESVILNRIVLSFQYCWNKPAKFSGGKQMWQKATCLWEALLEEGKSEIAVAYYKQT